MKQVKVVKPLSCKILHQDNSLQIPFRLHGLSFLSGALEEAVLTTAYQRYTEDGVNGLTSRSVTHHVKAVYATDSDRVRTHRKLSLSHFTVVRVGQRALFRCA